MVTQGTYKLLFLGKSVGLVEEDGRIFCIASAEAALGQTFVPRERVSSAAIKRKEKKCNLFNLRLSHTRSSFYGWQLESVTKTPDMHPY